MFLTSVGGRGISPNNILGNKVSLKEARRTLRNFEFYVPWSRLTAWTLSRLPRDVFIQTTKLLEMVKDHKRDNLRIHKPLPLILPSAKSLIILGAENIRLITESELSMKEIYDRAIDLDKPVVDLSSIPWIFQKYAAEDESV